MPSEQQHTAARGERRTQEQRRTATRAALLKAAGELVVESGVRALTLARVGERAGYSRGIVNHHFGSKQALLDALAKSSQSGFVSDVDDMPPGLERLVLLVEGYIRELGRDGLASRTFLLLWAEAVTAVELSATFQDRDEAFRSELRDDVAAGIRQGTIRADVDPQDVAVAVLGQLRGIGMQRLLTPSAVDTQRVSRTIAQQWRQVLST